MAGTAIHDFWASRPDQICAKKEAVDGRSGHDGKIRRSNQIARRIVATGAVHFRE